MLALLMPLIPAFAYGDVDELEILSPDKRLSVTVSAPDGIPHYRVAYDGAVVLLPSRLGFTFRNAKPMTGGFAVAAHGRRSIDEKWEQVWGETKRVKNRCNELRVAFEERARPKRIMHVTFRVFDDGIGFRYELPAQKALDHFEIVSEETRFVFADDHTVWWIPADYDSYEHLYTRSPLSEVEAVNTPVTIETENGLYVSIHEANLTDYAGMTLAAVPGEELALACTLVPWPDGVAVKGTTPMKTPWRTVLVATRPGGLIESHLILNLNEPCVIDDTSWITPMKYIGIWWEMHIKKSTWYIGPRHGATTENAKRYIDFASRHGIPAVLIEGWNTGWDRWGQKDAYDFITPYTDFDIEDVVRYGRERGVVIIGHHETGGDVPSYETCIDSAFAFYRRLGIPAVKTGYAGGIFPRGQHHHGQWMVNHYRSVVQKAAGYHIMLDAHEPIKPTGIRRTYPNMMTREGVRGMEYNAWSEGNTPEHTTILPFTRMLAGPLDYTPGIFGITFEEYQEVYRVHTTLAKQLALYVVLYSPLQMVADLPENYEGHPAFAFIEEVPVDWDETRVLDARIGDYVTIARRNGDRWYIGSITDEEARVLTAPLDFLTPGVRYRARIYADTPYTDWERTPTLFDIFEMSVDRESTLKLKLAPGGGQAISIAPMKTE
jgi:alpha-glucosidase